MYTNPIAICYQIYITGTQDVSVRHVLSVRLSRTVLCRKGWWTHRRISFTAGGLVSPSFYSLYVSCKWTIGIGTSARSCMVFSMWPCTVFDHSSKRIHDDWDSRHTHTHTHTHSNRRTSCLCAGELTVFCDAPDGDKPAECRRTDHASNGQSVVTITAHCAGLHSLHVRYNDVNVLGKVVTCNSVINSSSSRMGHRQGQLHMLLSPTGSVKSTRFT